MNEKLLEYIETSFLKDLLANENITDISFNGEEIYYKDNLKGRVKSEISISSNEAYSFLRQIANLTDSQFSFTNPILDVSVGRYRINGTHSSISRKNRENVVNFSIRVGYDKLRICENGEFINERVLKILLLAIKNKLSIVISGKTGTGKTEFQKFLISKMKENTRLVMIDNINELETDFFSKNLDSQTWLLLNNNQNLDFDSLIKNALRSNPDWIIIGETRGSEMLSALNSAMTGHPTITTLHSRNCESTYNRMTRMCMINNKTLSYDETLIDVYEHFKLIVHLKSLYDFEKKEIKRYVDSVGTNNNGKYYELYKYPSTFKPLPSSFRMDFELTSREFTKLNKEFLGAEK